MEVRQERTGWRDQELSLRHRMWGWDCPMVDLDFLGLEYDTKKPACLVEYKHECAKPGHKKEASYQALIELGNGYRAGIPVFAVRYASDFTWFKVTA